MSLEDGIAYPPVECETCGALVDVSEATGLDDVRRIYNAHECAGDRS